MKEKINSVVDSYRQEIIDATSRLVRIPSLKEESLENMPFGKPINDALLESLKIAEELQFITKNHQGYIGTIDATDKEPGLDMLAHLDVVPAPAKEWTVTQPFEPLEKDGKLYGRGTSDDKGPAICALYAMKAVKDLGIPLTRNVRLILGTDEESGFQDVEYYYKNNEAAPATISPDSTFPVTNVEKGRLSGVIHGAYPPSTDKGVLKIDCGVRSNVIPDLATAHIFGIDKNEVTSVATKWQVDTGLTLEIEENENGLLLHSKGIGGHGAYPEKANNALTGLVNLLALLPFGMTPQHAIIRNLSMLFPHGDWLGEAAGIAMDDEISGSLTLSFNMLELDDKVLKATFDARTTLESTKENTEDVFRRTAAPMSLCLEVTNTGAPHHVPAESPFVQTLLKVYEDYSGLKGVPNTTGGSTYVHGLENAVAFGPTMPGTETNIHGADEFAVVDEMLLATKIYAQVIIDLCS